MPNEELPQATEDALITLLMGAAIENGSYRELMAQAETLGFADRVESAMDRHAASQREAGFPGW